MLSRVIAKNVGDVFFETQCRIHVTNVPEIRLTRVFESHVHNCQPQANASGEQQSATSTSDARDIKYSGRITDQLCDPCLAYQL